MILDTNALSAYLDKTAAAVEVVSEASEIAIPVIVAGEFAFGIAQSRHREATNDLCSECWTGALSLTLTLRLPATTRPSGWS